MRKACRIFALFIALMLLLGVAPSRTMGQGPLSETVSLRVPDDQVPEKVLKVGVGETISIGPQADGGDSEGFISQKVPDDQIPEKVNKVEFKEVITLPMTDARGRELLGLATPRSRGTITLSYGFYWYQYSPTAVAVAGYARTQANFCCTRLYAWVVLRKDETHQGDWDYVDDDDAENTGSCVYDSGEAKTSYWTAPNGTDWKVETDHSARWNGGSGFWERQKVDSFP
jgi:hypothetical protein